MAARETKRGGGGPYNRAMSEFILRHMTGADLPGVLAVQAQCYGDALLESVAALESRLTLSPIPAGSPRAPTACQWPTC